MGEGDRQPPLGEAIRFFGRITSKTRVQANVSITELGFQVRLPNKRSTL